MNKVITLTKHVIKKMNNNTHCHLYNSATYVVIRHLLNIKLYYVIPAVVHQELKTMDECEKHFLYLRNTISKVSMYYNYYVTINMSFDRLES